MTKPLFSPQFARDVKRLQRRHVDLEPLNRVRVVIFERTGSHDELFRG